FRPTEPEPMIETVEALAEGTRERLAQLLFKRVGLLLSEVTVLDGVVDLVVARTGYGLLELGRLDAQFLGDPIQEGRAASRLGRRLSQHDADAIDADDERRKADGKPCSHSH